MYTLLYICYYLMHRTRSHASEHSGTLEAIQQKGKPTVKKKSNVQSTFKTKVETNTRKTQQVSA